jgi:hypothetical protein
MKRGRAMKWVEIIALRAPGNIDRELLDKLLKDVDDSDAATDTSKHLVAIKAYHHSLVETDLSIHIYWKSEPGIQDKSSLGLRFSSALRNLGLLNHSVWVETSARKFPLTDGNSERRDILESDRKDI